MKVLLKTISNVNINQLQLMLQFMQQRQIGLSDVFDAEQLALISAACAGQQPSHIAALQFAQMLRRLAHYIDDSSVALWIAQHVDTSHLGILGYLLHACDNMGEALLRLHRYGSLISNTMEQMQIIQVGNQIQLQWQPQEPIDGILLEMGIAIMCRFSDQLVGRPVTTSYIHFNHSHKGKADKIQDYVQFFNCPVHFSQPCTLVSFPAANLSIPIDKPDKTLLAILQQQADLALQHLPSRNLFLQDAQRKLIELCQYGEPTLVQLAAQLNLSSRTLQRRLMQQQLSFQQLLDEVRQQLCHQYLNQHVPLSDVAQLLGYSDQSAFTRAYKRWTGSTPLQQRRLNQPD